MKNLGAAIKIIQGLLGDPRGQWANRNYLLPLIEITYGDVNLNLKNGSAKNLQGIVTIPKVPAGTTSLYPWQNATAVAGNPPAGNVPTALLAGLYDPIEVWVKPAGASVWLYSQVRQIDTLPHVNPMLSNSNSIGPAMYWTWEGNRLNVTPVNQPLDFEVHGKFNPPPLAEDADLLCTHEDVWIPVCYQTAATAGVERTNPALLEGYATRAMASSDNIIAELIRQRQSTPQRFTKMARDSGMSQWFWS